MNSLSFPLTWPHFSAAFSNHSSGRNVPASVAKQIFQCLVGCDETFPVHSHPAFGLYLQKVCVQYSEKKHTVTLIFDEMIGKGQRKVAYAALKCTVHKDRSQLCFKPAVYVTATPNDASATYFTERAWAHHQYLYDTFKQNPDLFFPLCKLPYWTWTNETKTSCAYTQKRYSHTLSDLRNKPWNVRAAVLALAAQSLSQLHCDYLAFHGDITSCNFFVIKNKDPLFTYQVLLHDFDNTELLEAPMEEWLPDPQFSHLSQEERTVKQWLIQTPLMDILHFTRLIFGFLLQRELPSSFGHDVLLGRQDMWDRLLLPYRSTCETQEKQIQDLDEESLRNHYALSALVKLFTLVWDGTQALQQDPITYHLACTLPVNRIRSREEALKICLLLDAYLPHMFQYAEILNAIASL